MDKERKLMSDILEAREAVSQQDPTMHVLMDRSDPAIIRLYRVPIEISKVSELTDEQKEDSFFGLASTSIGLRIDKESVNV